MKLRSVRPLVCLLIGFACGLLHADDRTVILQVNESSPYWSKKIPSGGMGAEILQAISKEVGLTTRIEYVPLKRLIADTSNNELGNPLFYMTNQDFAAIIPIFTTYNAYFTYQKDKKTPTSNIPTKDNRIGVLIGTVGNTDVLREFGHFDESYSKESLFKKLKAGRVDTVLELYLVGRETVHQLYPNEIEHFKIHRLPDSGSPVAILIDSNYPDGARIASLYREGLHRIIKKGVYKKILEKYYGELKIPANWYTDLSKYEYLYSSDLGADSL